ncbi:hypothetical protein CDAR_393871 [Caerostris darwini]|uniref:Uncharacterized protein n=1 Tax=Caerostris darwini TaxID=1538125 RepID=A0AAV4PCJ8_9ARAC|nr:hypothetical protein CDAR_393871 [Caerostris darwini]
MNSFFSMKFRHFPFHQKKQKQESLFRIPYVWDLKQVMIFRGECLRIECSTLRYGEDRKLRGVPPPSLRTVAVILFSPTLAYLSILFLSLNVVFYGNEMLDRV